MAMELRKMSIDYERRRMQLQVYFGNFPVLCITLLALRSHFSTIFISLCDIVTVLFYYLFASSVA